MSLAMAGALPRLVPGTKQKGYNKPQFIERFVNALRSANPTAETDPKKLPKHVRIEYAMALDDAARVCCHCGEIAVDPMCVAGLGISSGSLAADAELSSDVFDGQVACRTCAPHVRIALCLKCSKTDALESDEREILMCTRCKVPATEMLSQLMLRKRRADDLTADDAILASAKRLRTDESASSWAQHEGSLTQREGED